MFYRFNAVLTRLTLAATMVTTLAAAPAWAAEAYWAAKADDVATAVESARDIYLKGDLGAAKRGVTNAYFHHFEDSKLEAAIRRFISAKRAAEIEKMFSTMRKAMTASDTAEVQRLTADLRESLTTEAKTLDAENVAPGVFEVNQ